MDWRVESPMPDLVRPAIQRAWRGGYVSGVNNALKYLARWLYIMAVTFSLGFLTVHFGRQTTWYKEKLYRQLLTGDADARLTAATKLALVGGEKQLLEALKADNPDVYSIAQRGLDHLWFTAAGHRAYKMIDEACAAADREDFPAALRLLDELTKKYPGFAEGWNRRGAVLWQTGQFLQSIKDCERALALNPNHYGALQGLGVCHLQLGDVEAACRSLRRALEIAPHEESTRRSLLKCELFLRRHSPERRGSSDLI